MINNINNLFSTELFIMLLFRVIPVLICITFHELAHGYTAYRLGDNTAKDMGRLTLNPIKHIDLLGLVMMMLLRFGWAKPVPVNMRNFKRPKWYMAITALAGPLSNVVLAAIVFFLYGLVYNALGGDKATGVAVFAIIIIENVIFISIALAVFNMLPLPPLDGSKILFSLLPESAYYKLMRYERYGMILLIIFVFSGLFEKTVFKYAFSLHDGMKAVFFEAARWLVGG